MMKYLVSVLTIILLTSCSQNTNIQEWELEIKSNQINIAYVGKIPSLEIEGATFKPLSTNHNDDYQILWIGESMYNSYENKIPEIKEKLNEGKVVAFIGNYNPKNIASGLGIKNSENNTDHSAFYFWMEEDDIYLGIIFTRDESNVEKNVLRVIVKLMRNI